MGFTHISDEKRKKYGDLLMKMNKNGGILSKNYENGQKVAIFYQIDKYIGYDTGCDNYGYLYRGQTLLGDYILENPHTGGVLLAKQIVDFEEVV